MSQRRPYRAPPPPSVPHGQEAAGFMFMSDKNTVGACLSQNLFGLPQNMMRRMDSIGDASLLFLMNKDKKEIHGVFRALGRPALDIDPDAYAPLSFPAQIRFQTTSVTLTIPKSSLSWAPRFGPLTDQQVEELQTVMAQAAADGAGGAGAGLDGRGGRGFSAAAATAGETEAGLVAASLAAATAAMSVSSPPYSPTSPNKAAGKVGNGGAGGGGAKSRGAKAIAGGGGGVGLNVAVIKLMVKRLEVETSTFKQELQQCGGGHGGGRGTTEEWPVRYSKLEEGKAAAVREGNYVKAAAYAQHIVDLKAMLVSEKLVAEKASMGHAALQAALRSAVESGEFLTAALLQTCIITQQADSTPPPPPPRAAVPAASAGAAGGAGGAVVKGVSGEEQALADFLASVGIPEAYASNLYKNGVKSAASLATVSEGRLTELGFKKGTRIKVLKWQESLDEPTSASTTTASATASTAAGVVGNGSGAGEEAEASPSSPQGAASAASAGGGAGSSEAALWTAIVEKLGMGEHVFQQLQEVGITTLDLLKLQNAETLASTGLKKGPRLKLLTAIGKLGDGEEL